MTEDKPRDPVAVAIEAFVKNRTQDLRFHAQATAQTILGRRMAGIRPVALAVEGESGWTLIDGVDLNVMTPHQAMKRADEVGKTFWQYSRLLDGPHIQTVGVVLNGQSHVEAKTHEAHDYALHRLKMDADSAIDGASSNSTADLEKALALPHTFQ